MLARFCFTVPGVAQPQGSKRIVGGAHPRLLDANVERLKPWRAAVTMVAVQAVETWCRKHHGFSDSQCPFPLTNPVEVQCNFIFPHPKSHYRTGEHASELKTTTPTWHSIRPDLDKLARAVLDSLTDAAIWVDDSQVSRLICTKTYGNQPQVQIEITELG